MEKSYSGKHPTLEEEQFDLNRALISMLNCRRYLASQRLQEVFGKNYDTNGIAGGYAIIVYPDGSTLTCDGFIKTSNRDSVLEEAVKKGVYLKPSKGYDRIERPRVVTSTFKENDYRTHLAIRDTTKKKRVFLSGIGHNAEMFAFVYNLTLVKDIIRDSDIEQFTKYQQGLEDAMKQDSLLTYSPKVSQRKSTQAQEVEMPQVETNFIDPWEIKVPKLGGKKNGIK